MREDEELQNKIEAGDHSDFSEDALLYRKIFSALERETSFLLPSSFSYQLIQKLEEEKRKETARDKWLFFGGLFVLFIGFGVALYFISFKPALGVYTFIKGYPGLIVFGLLFIFLLNFIDRKFIRPMITSNHN